MRSMFFTLLLSAMALLAAACGQADTGSGEMASDPAQTPAAQEERPSVTIGSTNFAEQEIVAEMYALVLEEAGFPIERRYQLGSREVVLPALQNGDIDAYPEYVGTALEFLSGGAGEATSDTQATTEKLRERFAQDGIVVLEPSEAQDRNTLVVTQETADELGLATVSDLEGKAGELTLGGPPECPQRPLCIPGYEEVYGLEFGDFRSLDAGGPLTVEALEDGTIDVALMFSSQGIIADKGWVALEEDKDLQPAENLVPVLREEVATEELTTLLNEVSAALDTEKLIELNRQVDVDGDAPADVAERFLTDQGLIGS